MEELRRLNPHLGDFVLLQRFVEGKKIGHLTAAKLMQKWVSEDDYDKDDFETLVSILMRRSSETKA